LNQFGSIGEGIVGVVYKGKYLGTDVAVKKLKFSNQFTEKTIQQFKTEVMIPLNFVFYHLPRKLF
jgi:hypothetical protein